ncbi:hypothetical protein N7520_003040 [Penicillium odoratum]|uniref:uncharacterized protein n=1 Tax=Penicillium odoratum TaxID=1167516 RepID=UPI00254933D0|nr:uncharacterized protein N7520_003040 [Penicillium odoratum]KAJ5772511.1 hypothetical protein N7520_003040 [Penicillium odoratum]
MESFVMDHEFCGTVKDVVKGSSLKIGDKVIVDPTQTCETCFCCLNGWGPQCPKLSFIRFPSGKGGGSLNELVTVEESKLLKLPDNIAFKDAALAEPLAVGLHAMRKAELPDENWPQQTIVVIGGGPVGYAVLLNLLAFGADPDRIIVSEPTELRRNGLKTLGVHVVSPEKDDVGKFSQELTQGEGFDIAFDCAGVTQSAATAMATLRPQATYINVAFWGANITIPFMEFFRKEITCRSSMAYSAGDFQQAVYLMSQEHTDEAFQELLNQRDRHLKILITPKESNLTTAIA